MKALHWTLLSILFVGALAFGVTEVPEGDPLASLLAAFMNIKSLDALGIASAAITIFVQGVKKYFPTIQAYDIIVVVGGLAYGVVQAMITGSNLTQALVFILISSGGAMLLYDLFKTPINKVLPVPVPYKK